MDAASLPLAAKSQLDFHHLPHVQLVQAVQCFTSRSDLFFGVGLWLELLVCAEFKIMYMSGQSSIAPVNSSCKEF